MPCEVKLLQVLFHTEIHPLIRGIGIALEFIHIDTDFTKDTDVVWMYPFNYVQLEKWKKDNEPKSS